MRPVVQRSSWCSVLHRPILMQRGEQSVDLPDGDLQDCFVVVGKRIGRGHLTSMFVMK